MGISTYLDAVAIGLPAILGLLGAWMGFGRLLVSWPIRWLVAFFGACIAALLATLYLMVNAEIADLLYVSGTAAKTAISAVAFLASLVMLLMFMSNLRARVVVWIGHRPIGSMQRVFGGLFGVACGLLLVVWLVGIPHMLYESMRPDRNGDPAWMRESLALPHIRSASEAMKNTLSSYFLSGKPGQR